MIDHEKNLRKAIELSKQSIDSGSSPFGCVIIDAEGKIVGEGHNRVAPDNDPTAHGEVVAIRNACRNLGTFDLSGCILYTSCEPCPMCLNACKWANIDEVVVFPCVPATHKPRSVRVISPKTRARFINVKPFVLK